LIDEQDRSLRTIFGDGAAATLIESHDQPSLSGFKFGTDGKGANTLLATQNGFRKDAQVAPRHRRRWKSDLYMDGPALINFTVGAIPGLIDDVLEAAETSMDEIGFRQLQQALEVTEERVPILLQDA